MMSEETRNKISISSKRWYASLTDQQKKDRSEFLHFSNHHTNLGKHWINLGRVHTEKTKQIHRELAYKQLLNNNTLFGRNRGSTGTRMDLGLFFRSRWEANYARYLNWLVNNAIILKWEYEPETFWFTKIKRGTRSYLPDFKITNNDRTTEYHEIKGWMDPKSRTKLDRMAKYYPEIKLLVIDGIFYKDLRRKMSRILENWEE